MLEYDYLIQRNEGNSEVKYAPLAIPKTLPNLVYIEGPNSSGKSTLLNFIALGLHGIENRNLNPVLLEKLKTILNSDHQKINFCFTITDEKNDLKLIAKKENVNTNEIKLYEETPAGNKLLIPEIFEKKYDLIYDIPNNLSTAA